MEDKERCDYNEWFDEVSEEEFYEFENSIRLLSKHVVFEDGDLKLEGKTVGFIANSEDGVVFCVINEDIKL